MRRLRMAVEEASYRGKVRKAAQILLFQRHRKPGVKGWELKRLLGRNYLKIIQLLDGELDKLGLKVKVIFEGREEDYDYARFLVTLKEPVGVSGALKAGWRIDDVAALAAATAYIASRQGKVKRSDVEELLSEKLPKWRVELLIDRFVRTGYLAEDEDGFLSLDWRAKAEIDLEALVKGIVIA
ncbi:MAG: hypothetical protein QXK12_08355 [Candidatus Nezhaarchaeales archaeon]